jgi:hypothetical protein
MKAVVAMTRTKSAKPHGNKMRLWWALVVLAPLAGLVLAAALLFYLEPHPESGFVAGPVVPGGHLTFTVPWPAEDLNGRSIDLVMMLGIAPHIITKDLRISIGFIDPEGGGAETTLTTFTPELDPLAKGLVNVPVRINLAPSLQTTRGTIRRLDQKRVAFTMGLEQSGHRYGHAYILRAEVVTAASDFPHGHISMR